MSLAGNGKLAFRPMGLKTTSKKRKVAAAASSAASGPAAAPALEQMYLDFNQRSFGRTVECAQCGLRYCEGEPTDEAMHRKHHRRVMAGVLVRGGAAERVVDRLANGRPIVAIHSTDPTERLRKLSEIKRVVDAELGAATQELPAAFRAFLCLEANGRMIGCAIAEPVSWADKLPP